MSAPKLRVTLSAATPKDGALHLSYELSNLSGDELGILDRVPVVTDFSRPPRLDPENAYLWIEGETLVVWKSVEPLPAGLRVSEKTAPGITRLAAGASRAEEIAIPLPARAFAPHRAAAMRLSTPGSEDVVATAPKTAARVRLVVGSFTVGAARLVPADPAYPGVFAAVPPGAPFMTLTEATSEIAAEAPFDALEYAVVMEPQDHGADDHGKHE